MRNTQASKEIIQLWKFTVDIAIKLCELLEQDHNYKNIRLLYENGQMMVSNNFKNQKELLYPISSESKIKSLWINANNPNDFENPMQIQAVLHFQPKLKNTVCLIWKTDEQFEFSLQDNLDSDTLAQDIFAKVESKFAI
ncbi:MULTISPECIES: hypothetical protein [unclassified Polaribacter]|uniref:hypothetical protein n=1 Tax=unclassified Polaribacter TaxID=196858 RepID=UPI0011BE2738|nr:MULTISPECIES: hypothetical protein [unclassified Polaribacter]TXD50498.1 hypothetical protein ES043_15775 [Polaribacter sp. IC063]TXD61038.1 hypothetical protein ES044_05645 [Polaribacter sp. IC066]